MYIDWAERTGLVGLVREIGPSNYYIFESVICVTFIMNSTVIHTAMRLKAYFNVVRTCMELGFDVIHTHTL